MTAPRCKTLVLDAGPLLSLSPLRGLAETYLTVPQVLDELKDKRAREHFEQLALSTGVKIEIKSPDSESLLHVIKFAKKTGDYSVLSNADLCVLALTYMLDKKEKEEGKKGKEKDASATASTSDSQVERDLATQLKNAIISEPDPTGLETDAQAVAQALIEDHPGPTDALNHVPEISSEPVFAPLDHAEENNDTEIVPESSSKIPPIEDKEVDQVADLESLDVELVSSSPAPTSPQPQAPISEINADAPLFEDPSDSDDGEGEWITPANVALHKSRALDLIPSGGPKKDKKDERITVGCMTADFAMQNVLLHMDLNLVGSEGKRIERLKSWVLRCHACFKICKDNSKKFCPSCGNPTLIRASVTISSPSASSSAPVMQVHLKPNFQYRTRGTKYSIPAPKPGSAKTGPGEGLILREDQAEYRRAQKMADGRREREEARLLKGAVKNAEAGNHSSGVMGSWMDPDWVPEMLIASAGGKGRTTRGGPGEMPTIGHGRRNPNEARKKRK